MSERGSEHDSEYVRHLSGVAALLAWMERWSLQADPVAVSGPWIHVGSLASQRVALGRARRRKDGKHPFLGFQPDERIWAERMTFDRAVSVPSAERLALVTRAFRSDGHDRVDLPAFALIFEFDEIQKLEAASATGRLGARPLWWGVGQEPRVGGVLWSVPVVTAESVRDVLNPAEIENRQDFDSLFRAQVDRTNRYVNPGYKGSLAQVDPALQKLLSPFRPE